MPLHLLVKWEVVSQNSREGQLESISIICSDSLVLILYLKCGGGLGGGCNVFHTFYAISNISRTKNLGIQNNYFSFNVFFVFFISRRRRRPGDGRYCNAPRPSVRPSVCLSVTFSFRTVTQKRITVFSRNFAGTCTK